MEIAVLALGCFQGPEIKLGKLNGVVKTEVGYCGGNDPNTTYERVCSGSTNHAETVKIEFDENEVSYEELVKVFFKIHDPTQLNRQGPDIGTQYRSEIFYKDENQKKIAEKIKNEFNEKLKGKVVTNISREKLYQPAEEYHQYYLKRKNIL